MKLGISMSINVAKIDKSRLFEGKNGAKYLNLTSFIDTNVTGQYGDHGTIKQSTTKEERESGVQTEILGNVKVFYTGESTQAEPQRNAKPGDDDLEDCNLPF
jgi:hypothetical protein